MKVDLKGLLLMARRHLAILDTVETYIVKEQNLDVDDALEDIEVNNAALILDELIDHVSEVQADEQKLEEFAVLYCLKKSVSSNESASTPQPLPIHRTTAPIHDLVIIDLIQPCDSHGEGIGLLSRQLNKRKAIGLAEYGTPLQAFNGRDCETDVIEEMADSICYLKQSILEGKDYLEPIYHRAIALAVDTINLREIHKNDDGNIGVGYPT